MTSKNTAFSLFLFFFIWRGRKRKQLKECHYKEKPKQHNIQLWKTTKNLAKYHHLEHTIPQTEVKCICEKTLISIKCKTKKNLFTKKNASHEDGVIFLLSLYSWNGVTLTTFSALRATKLCCMSRNLKVRKLGKSPLPHLHLNASEFLVSISFSDEAYGVSKWRCANPHKAQSFSES